MSDGNFLVSGKTEGKADRSGKLYSHASFNDGDTF